MELDSDSDLMELTDEVDTKSSGSGSSFVSVKWILLFLILTTVFTVFNIPEAKVQKWMLGTINDFGRKAGFRLDGGVIGYSWWGPTIQITDSPKIVFNRLAGSTVELDEVSVSPNLIGLLFGNQGGEVTGRYKKGTFKANVSIGSSFKADLSFDRFDLAKTGVLPLAIGMAVGPKRMRIAGKPIAISSGVISGTADLEGEIQKPSSLAGALDLKLSRFSLPGQKILINVPAIQISESKMNVGIRNGKANVKTLQLGKTGSSDDLIGTASGDVQLRSSIPSSTVNMRTNFKISDRVLKKLFLLDALLGKHKKADGSFELKIRGTLQAPVFSPEGSGAVPRKTRVSTRPKPSSKKGVSPKPNAAVRDRLRSRGKPKSQPVKRRTPPPGRSAPLPGS